MIKTVFQTKEYKIDPTQLERDHFRIVNDERYIKALNKGIGNIKSQYQPDLATKIPRIYTMLLNKLHLNII